MTRFENYINEELLTENIFKKYMNKISNKSSSAVESLMRSSWMKLERLLKSNQLEQDALDIINKHLKTNYRNLNQISKAKIATMPTKGVYEETMINEDFKHYWELIKTEGFPALSFYPLLQILLEIDKLIKSTGEVSYPTMLVYGLFWLFLISGKFMKGWKKWKQENPEEFKKEGAKSNPLSLKKTKIKRVYDKEW